MSLLKLSELDWNIYFFKFTQNNFNFTNTLQNVDFFETQNKKIDLDLSPFRN